MRIDVMRQRVARIGHGRWHVRSERGHRENADAAENTLPRDSNALKDGGRGTTRSPPELFITVGPVARLGRGVRAAAPDLFGP